MIKYAVWDYLGITKEEFEKIRSTTNRLCLVRGCNREVQLLGYSLCLPHRRAYRRKRNR